MESDIKHKNPNFKEDKTENVSRALFFAEQQEGHHLKSPIRVFPNPSILPESLYLFLRIWLSTVQQNE
jgi:hypothetical protein